MMMEKLCKTNRGEIPIYMFKKTANTMHAGKLGCSAAKQFGIDQTTS